MTCHLPASSSRATAIRDVQPRDQEEVDNLKRSVGAIDRRGSAVWGVGEHLAVFDRQGLTVPQPDHKSLEGAGTVEPGHRFGSHCFKSVSTAIATINIAVIVWQARKIGRVRVYFYL